MGNTGSATHHADPEDIGSKIAKLRDDSIDTLQFSENVDDARAVELAEALRDNYSLETLAFGDPATSVLSKSTFGPAGACALADAIRHHPNLESLSVCFNENLGDAGAHALVSACAHHGQLRTLVLHGCALTRVPDPVRRCTGLETLVMSDNLLESVPPFLSVMGSLRRIWLGGNPMRTSLALPLWFIGTVFRPWKHWVLDAVTVALVAAVIAVGFVLGTGEDGRGGGGLAALASFALISVFFFILFAQSLFVGIFKVTVRHEGTTVRVRATLANAAFYIAMLVDSVQLQALTVNESVSRWPGSAERASSLVLFDPEEAFAVTFYACVGLALLQRLLLELLRLKLTWSRPHAFFSALGVDPSKPLTVFTSLTFVLTTRRLMSGIACTFTDAGAFLDRDPRIQCWTAEHVPYAALAMLSLLVYVPGAIVSGPVWISMDPQLDLKPDKNFLILSEQSKFVLTIATTFFRTKPIPFLVVSTSILVFLFVLSLWRPPTGHKITNILRSCSYLAPLLLSSVGMYGYHKLRSGAGTEDAIGMSLVFSSYGITAIFGISAIVSRRMRSETAEPVPAAEARDAAHASPGPAAAVEPAPGIDGDAASLDGDPSGGYGGPQDGGKDPREKRASVMASFISPVTNLVQQDHRDDANARAGVADRGRRGSNWSLYDFIAGSEVGTDVGSESSSVSFAASASGEEHAWYSEWARMLFVAKYRVEEDVDEEIPDVENGKDQL